ncbi:MAG: ABC transporter permease [Propylenella sp.]
MAITLDDTIGRRQHTTLAWILSRQTFWIFVALLIFFTYMAIASPPFLTGSNLFNITRNFTFTAIIALGMTLVIITGGIDLSVGSVLVLCSMIVAVVMHLGFNIYVGIGASLATALIVGAFNGVLIAYVGMPPFVVTLGMLSIARSLAMVASGNTTVFQFGPDHNKLLAVGGGSLRIPVFGDELVIAYPVIYTIVLALITGYVLLWTKFGRYVFAIGGNEQAAILTGVPVRRVKLAVYMISSLSAGLCAIVMTGWLGAVTTNLGTGMELQVIAATVIGGANLAGGSGTAFGALIGAALIEIIRNSLGLLGVNAFWQGTFIGAAILLAVLFERIRDSREKLIHALRALAMLLRLTRVVGG